MKVKSLLSVLAFSSISLIAHAAETDNLAVYSTQQDKGATSLGKQSFHTKSFDVTLANIGDKDADLSKLCLKAYNGHGKPFKLDTIDETLTTEKLAPKKTLKGIAVFASNDESVYDASLVKLSDDCDNHDKK